MKTKIVIVLLISTLLLITQGEYLVANTALVSYIPRVSPDNADITLSIKDDTVISPLDIEGKLTIRNKQKFPIVLHGFFTSGDDVAFHIKNDTITKGTYYFSSECGPCNEILFSGETISYHFKLDILYSDNFTLHPGEYKLFGYFVGDQGTLISDGVTFEIVP